MNTDDMVSVECECCADSMKTHNTPMVGDWRRMVEIWRCSECGRPCSNRRCDGFQREVFKGREVVH